MGAVLGSNDVLAIGPGIAGGKSHALAAALAADCPVPSFFVVTPDALDAQGSLLPNVAVDIAARLQTLADEGFTRFAVRSSARSEDSAADSHAGQFLSLVDTVAPDVPAAIVRVIGSGLADGVAGYRAARGLAGHELPAVVVQGMVAASAAGVAFSADPASGRTDRIVISAVRGLGDRLVSGEVDGETWRLAKPGLDILEQPANGALSPDQARAVARLCLHAEARKKHPQDVEWAFGSNGEGPYHLQDRAITTRLLPSCAAETELTVLDNSNIVESYPGLISPLTFSFAAMAYDRVYRSFLRMVGVRQQTIDAHAADLANMLSLVDGRMFYNLGSWYRLLSLLPLFSRNRKSMEMMMGVSQPIPDEALGATPTPGSRATLRMIFGLAREAILLPRTRARFLKRMADSVPPGRSADDLINKPLSALAAEYRRIEAALLDRWDAPIVNDFLCMMAYGGSRRLLERWAGAPGLALHNDVMIGQGDIISAEPARLIRAAGDTLAAAGESLRAACERGDVDAAFADPAFGAKLRDYIDRFGDRRIGELKLESPTLSDDAKPLLAAVAAASRKTGTAAHTATDPDTTLATLFAGRPLRRLIVSALLRYTKARVRDRENLRFERTRIFGRARRVFLAIGAALAASGRMAAAGDVFSLTIQEALGAAEGNAVTHDLRSLGALRKREQAEQAALPDPPERILLRGSVGDRSARFHTSAAARNAAIDANERRGTACGSGRAQGRVRVIRDPVKDQLRPGEILVARHTDPGWIQHFVNAAAVIVERGSVLSHSAIVSRELGIPCVVALADACTWLADGDCIEIDGSTGMVRRIDG